MKSFEDLERAFERGLTSWEKTIAVRHAQRMGARIVRETKRLTPVGKNTPAPGNLRRRWFFRVDADTGEIRIWALNDAEYAAWVNNGHRVVRRGKVVGIARGKHMLQQAIDCYRQNYMRQDVEAMLEDLKRAMR